MSEDSENGLDFSTITDPYAQREAEKYEQPIPSRELILQLLEKGGRPKFYSLYYYPLSPSIWKMLILA
jgi:hypothetical protein